MCVDEREQEAPLPSLSVYPSIHLCVEESSRVLHLCSRGGGYVDVRVAPSDVMNVVVARANTALHTGDEPCVSVYQANPEELASECLRGGFRDNPSPTSLFSQ